MRQDLSPLAAETLAAAERAGLSLAAAESCTGGHIASLLTGVEGLSHKFEAGFVVYSDEAKSTVLEIPLSDVKKFGAVSREIVLAMAEGAVGLSRADVAVAVSGFTGGTEGDEENGLVHIAVADRTGRCFDREYHFGDVGRDEGRDLAAAAALVMLKNAIAAGCGMTVRKEEAA